MKITVPLFSRNRPAGLLAVLTALEALSTGAHDITYPLIVDDDDEKTLECLASWAIHGMLPAGAVQVVGRRDRTLNSRMNDACKAFPADAYYFAPDDGYPLTQHWDRIFKAAHDQGLPAWCWLEHNAPGDATFICLSERWRQALGRAFPEYFPYWFADTWIAEVHLLCFAKPMALINQLAMGGKRGKTQGMRDLRFWLQFFAHTRAERIAEAEHLARAFGFTVSVERERSHFVRQLEQVDAEQMERADAMGQRFGADLGEPTPVYLAAKAKAEELMDRRIVVLH